MSEQETMDRLLRESMAADAPPSLSPAFERRLAKRLRRRTLDSKGRLVMALYSLIALAVSVWTMRRGPFGWVPTAVAILVPLAIAAAATYRATRQA